MPKKALYAASTYSHLKNFHLPYIRFLKETGFEVTVLAGGEKKEIPCADVVWHAPFEKKMASPKNFAVAFKIARLIKKERYDLVSTHTALAAFFTRLAVMMAGKGSSFVINTSHGYLFDGRTNPFKKAVLLAAEKITAPVTDVVFTMNRQDAEIAARHRLARKSILRIDGMGADTSKFLKTAPDVGLRERLGLREDDFVLICAAEFSKRKNQRMLISALCGLPENIRLLLPGEGALFEVCRRQARESGLEKRVLFPGHVAHMPAYYRASDVCVSASRIEGLPFSIMESMATGLPVVASRIKGHEDLIEDGENGYLYEYDDIEAFCSAVMRLYRDPGLSARIGLRNADSVGKYSIESVLPQITGLLAPYI